MVDPALADMTYSHLLSTPILRVNRIDDLAIATYCQARSGGKERRAEKSINESGNARAREWRVPGGCGE
jgi:hypothetical protein